MRRLGILLWLLAAPLLAQNRISLFNQVEANPSAATGDIYYTQSSGGRILRLAIGTSGQALTVSSGLPAWAVLGIAGGGTNNSSAYTAGSIIYSDGTKLTQDNSHLYYDATHHWVGIGVSPPNGPLEVEDNRSGVVSQMSFANIGAGDAQLVIAAPSGQYESVFLNVIGSNGWLMQNTSTNYFRICDTSVSSICGSTAERFKIDTSGNAQLPYGQLAVGTTISGSSQLLLNGYIDMAGSSSGVVSIKTQAAAGTFNFNLPITAGTANGPLLSQGGGSTAMTWGTRSGNTTTFGTTSGTLTNTHCVSIDSNGNLVDNGAACAAGGTGTVTSISTTSPLTGCSSPCTSTATIGAPAFVSAGGSHAAGTVPDPGSTLHSPPYLLGEDGTFHNPALAGGGNFITNTAAGSEPGSPNTGDMNLPTNGLALNDYNGSNWHARNFGPVYPLTYPPETTSGISTTLSGNGGSITNVATTALVASTSGFPSTPFIIQIGTESMKVTNVSSLTLTIVRGINATTAASHTDGTTVTVLNWDWVNQGTSSATQITNTGIYLVMTKTNTTNRRAYVRMIPTGINSASMILLPNLFGASHGVGILLYETSSNKSAVMTFITPASSGALTSDVEHVASPLSNGTGTVDTAAFTILNTRPIMFKVDPHGSNIIYSISADGLNWIQATSVAKTTQFTTAPDEWGILLYDGTDNVWDNSATLISWLEQ
jgi:hypothetical protein